MGFEFELEVRVRGSGWVVLVRSVRDRVMDRKEVYVEKCWRGSWMWLVRGWCEVGEWLARGWVVREVGESSVESSAR